jgi:hypothetical protein
MATETEGAPSPMPEMSAPEVPQAKPLATQIDEIVASMEKPQPRGMRKVKKDEPKKGPAPKEEEKKEEAKAEEPKKEAPPKPEEPKPEPVTQERLSAGFAKLERQKRAVAREEQRIKAESERLQAQLAEFESTRTSKMSDLEKRQAEIDALAKLLDDDADQFVDAIAKKKGLSKDAIYDKWTRQKLNGGTPAPEDMIQKSNAETEALKKKLEEIEAREKAKEEESKKAKEEAEQRARMEQAVAAENAGFIKHVKEAGKYPLLSKESDEDIVKYGRYAAGNNAVPYNEIAAYLEEQLSFQIWKEAQAGQPAKAETPKTESAPKAEGKPAEPKKANTITNQMTAVRTVKSESTPRNDDERLAFALKTAWPDKR